MKKLYKKYISTLFLIFGIFAPFFASARTIIPCETVENPGHCNFDSLMTLINNVIDFLLKDMAVPLAAIAFAYGGFLLISSGGSSEAKTKAKHVLISVVTGFIIALASWVIVKFILYMLGANDALLFLGIKS